MKKSVDKVKIAPGIKISEMAFVTISLNIFCIIWENWNKTNRKPNEKENLYAFS